MKTKTIMLSLLFAAGVIFTSCQKDDDDNTNPKPVINLTELGYENSGVAYIGSDLHIEAEIVAEAKIDKIEVEIHPEGEHEHKVITVILDEGEWEVDTIYTEFSGLINTTFHKHLDVPMHADTGHYHFHFAVTDRDGQQTVAEMELHVMTPPDDVAPELSITNAPEANKVFSSGSTISISGLVSDDKALGGLYVGLVRADQNLEDGAVNATNTLTLLHTHDFESTTSHNFSAEITVGAELDNNSEPKPITGDIAWQSANYYILVKVKDAFGGNWAYSMHYPIEINVE